MMAGNGSLGLELLDDLPEMTDVFISIGGGGLIAGMMLAIKSVKPQVRIWGVETEGADTMGTGSCTPVKSSRSSPFPWLKPWGRRMSLKMP